MIFQVNDWCSADNNKGDDRLVHWGYEIRDRAFYYKYSPLSQMKRMANVIWKEDKKRREEKRGRCGIKDDGKMRSRKTYPQKGDIQLKE